MGLYDIACFGCKGIWNIVHGYDVRPPYVDASDVVNVARGSGKDPTTSLAAKVALLINK